MMLYYCFMMLYYLTCDKNGPGIAKVFFMRKLSIKRNTILGLNRHLSINIEVHILALLFSHTPFHLNVKTNLSKHSEVC